MKKIVSFRKKIKMKKNKIYAYENNCVGKATDPHAHWENGAMVCYNLLPNICCEC